MCILTPFPSIYSLTPPMQSLNGDCLLNQGKKQHLLMIYKVKSLSFETRIDHNICTQRATVFIKCLNHTAFLCNDVYEGL